MKSSQAQYATMNNTLFQFGESLPEYNVPVLNERAVRASAGILFFFAIVTFMNAWLMGNFQPTRVFVVAFLVDFSIRIFVNPRYAPSLIVGQWAVRRQVPEYVGAPQKRFAWAIGFVLALSMLYLMVLNSVIGPINMVVCGLCLLLLFFETAFGICIGCKVYNLLNKEQAQLCPGGVCTLPADQASPVRLVEVAIVVAFVVLIGAAAQWIHHTAPPLSFPMQHSAAAKSSAPVDPAEVERCKVPEFAKAMGHEEKWKQHNNCQ